MKYRPYIFGGLFLFSGYVYASVKRVKRPIPGKLITFYRKEQLNRLKQKQPVISCRTCCQK